MSDESIACTYSPVTFGTEPWYELKGVHESTAADHMYELGEAFGLTVLVGLRDRDTVSIYVSDRLGQPLTDLKLECIYGYLLGRCAYVPEGE